MARPVKQGLDYYPLDVEFYRDIKVRRLNHAFGAASTVILLTLLGAVYKDEGYYAKWSEDLCFLVATDSFAEEELVTAVVTKALAVGLFDQDCFDRYGILTSAAIQRHYLAATYKRKQVKLVAEYFLVPEDDLANISLTSLDGAKPLATPVDTPVAKQTAKPVANVPHEELTAEAENAVAFAEEAALASLAAAMPPEPAETDPLPKEEETVECGETAQITASQLDKDSEVLAFAPFHETPASANLAPVLPLAIPEKVAVIAQRSFGELKTTGTYQAWCELWRQPNRLVQKEIARLVNEYGDAVVGQAIQIAGEKQVQAPHALSFVRSCLWEWQAAGARDLASIAAYQAQRSRKLSREQTGFGQKRLAKKAADPSVMGEAWDEVTTPTVDRKSWLRLQKECYLFMGDDYQVDTSYAVTPAELAWICQPEADYQNPVYVQANQRGN